MRKLRVLSCVLLACFISCTTLGSAFASGILIDDLPIDPWGDLEDVENYEPPEPSDPNFSDPYAKPEEPPLFNPVVTLSLDDVSNVRTVTWNKSFKVGGYNSAGVGLTTVSVSAGSVTGAMTGSNNNLMYIYQGSTSKYGGYISVTAGTYIDVIAPDVSYSGADYESITVTGGGTFYFRGGAGDWESLIPDTVQLLVNGVLVGESVSVNSSTGTFTLPTYTDELNEDITSLGFRFLFSSAKTANSTYTNYGADSYHAFIVLSDDTVFVVTELPEEPEYNGLLDTIIGWLRSIWDGIKSIGQSILDGLEGLFVPSESDIVEIKEMYSALLEERLGFVYEAFVMLDDAFTELKTAFESGNGYTFTFPGISFPMNGEIITIVEEQEINMENEFMDTVRPVFGTIVCLFSVAGVVRTGADMVVAIISGVSPFAFYRKADEIWETLWGEDS